jgi:phosphoribosylanthranilate isomerase
MHIKICGITNLEDALAAADCGADHLGFNFYPRSPRCIRPEDCARIAATVCRRHPDVIIVGVFVNHSTLEIARTARACRLDLIQLSGDEPVETLAELAGHGIRSFKAARQGMDRTRIAAFAAHITRAPALLLDASLPGAYGGTGLKADWTWAAVIAAEFPVFLAGGLTADSVGNAIRKVRPWGVDAASGVESAPGKKDHDAMRVFCSAVMAVNRR